MKLYGIDGKEYPLEDAKKWMEGMLSMANNIFVWEIPRADSTYEISKRAKTFELIDGRGDKPVEFVMFSLGYTKIERKE